jgi:hypothetical protein
MSLVETDPRQLLPCGIFYSLLIGPTILSNLYLASFSIDRSFMLLNPTRYRLLITRRHVFVRVLLILLIVILFMTPHHYYFYYDKNTTLFLCEFHTFVDRWRLRIWPFLHAILFVSIPLLITTVSSLFLVHNRCEHRKATNNNVSESARRLERNAIVVACVSIAIAFALLPIVILQIFMVHDRLYNHDVYCSRRWKTYPILLYCFLTLSAFTYSFKFYLRLMISKLFQRDFLQVISCVHLQRVEANAQHSIPLQDRAIASNNLNSSNHRRDAL